MDYHNSFSPGGNSLLNKVIVNLKGMDIRLYEYRYEPVLCDSKNTGNIGISRYDDLITLLHHTHLLIGAEDKCQRIKTITTAYAIFRTDIRGIVFLKALRYLTFEIPSALQHLIGNMHIGFVDGL